MLQTLQFSIRLPRGIRIMNDLGALTNRPVSVRLTQELLVPSQRLYLVNYIGFLYIIQPITIIKSLFSLQSEIGTMLCINQPQ